MIYPKTLEYLYARLPMYHRIGAQAYKADLGNTIALCRMLGNPENSFRSIHVTGTNGKGSVAHMLASILQNAGFRTGLYTSPHLKDFRERIRLNGKMISKKNVSEFVDTYRDRFEPISPSFFELTVGMAFDYFRNRQAEIVVVEAGLGGRLDSTNIITPMVSVITNVSYDHMQFLGDTLEKIAAEKAGIIKPGVPVVIGETQESTIPVFINKAEQSSSTILWADQRFNAEGFELIGKQPGKRIMSVTRDGTPFISRLVSPLTGIYQKKNILTVLGVCEVLNDLGFALSQTMIRNGIKDVIRNTALAGRWHVLTSRPLTICDTGHNEGGLREVLVQIASTPHKHLHFVFGVVNDKELHPILSLLPRDATYYFCKPDIPRGLEAEILQSRAMAAGLTGECYRSVNTALKAAQENAGISDLVFVGGSTFVVAEVL